MYMKSSSARDKVERLAEQTQLQLQDAICRGLACREMEQGVRKGRVR